MRMADPMQAVRNQAAEALKAVLHGVSQIKLETIDVDSPGPNLKVDMLAHVDVHGHRHTLVCKVTTSGRPDYVRTALKEFRDEAEQTQGHSTLVFIAPQISDEVKALCGESKAGFLDLEGNAHLELGEVFIVKRTLSKAVGSTKMSLPVHQNVALAGVA